ncbi:MAG: hypothetical protein J2P27_07040 [Actinobacteria bacterium]|nr:hypothetical protein [Actinomycetota bacterium]
MAIAVLVLWLCTAAAGVTLLRSGVARRRAAAGQVPAPEQALVRTGAVPLTPEGKPPPGPHARVSSPPGEHPLLEFSHPALATIGVACWFMFTFVHYRPFAWISLAILAATLLVGVSWFARSRLASLRHGGSGWRFPPRLIALHGAVAALSIALTVLTALVAS